jgi:signal transduction histidine kinase/ActR/RegA family two-component response regulator
MMTRGIELDRRHEGLTSLKHAVYGADGSGADRGRFVRLPGSESHVKRRVENVRGAAPRAGDDERQREFSDDGTDGATGPVQGRSERDILRETFDTFVEGLCVVGFGGALEVSNATGGRLYATALREELRAAARETVERGAALDRSLSLDGRTFALRAYPISGRRAVLSMRDTTDEREDEVRRLQAEKLASIGMLAAGVAHEINNPTAFVLANIEALTGHLRLLQEKVRELPEPVVAGLGLPDVLFEATAILQESKEGMARIHRIVRDLGSFSHVDDDGATTLDVNAAVESALTMLRNEIKYRARIERDLRSTQAVRANHARLGQVFLNIILNAAQALDETAAKRNVVRVRSFDEGEFVVIEVEDNGPGIPSEVVPRIFDSFFTTKPRGIGTGLGLPISLGIIRTLGGQLTVDSRPGEGATFRVRLPAVAAVPSTLTPPSDVTPPPRTFIKRRVLAVDDEPLLLKAYRRMLSEVHVVETALGGVEALRALERDANYDVVLCDLQMPEVSGMRLHEQVRARWPALAERFVFVTGGAFSPDAKRFLEESTCAVIQKPFRIEDLLALVDRKTRQDAGPRDEQPPSTLGASLSS